ncbi:hypothetical protein [Paraburkholderia phenazinium]|uniref:hypothetical protein n=1 Tax=Paraburkholderia phenazinium TaxID=60549 RepID=UPI001FC9878A|nr:hypothetical protein [Paraburkholderia phenazinium]
MSLPGRRGLQRRVAEYKSKSIDAPVWCFRIEPFKSKENTEQNETHNRGFNEAAFNRGGSFRHSGGRVRRRQWQFIEQPVVQRLARDKSQRGPTEL